MAIRGANLTFSGWKKNLGAQKAYKKNQQENCNLYFVAPFEFSGQAPFKLVTPLNTNRTILTL